MVFVNLFIPEVGDSFNKKNPIVVAHTRMLSNANN